MEQVDVASNRKYPGVLRWVLIIGIMIVLNLFFNYAARIAFKEPQFEKFCPQSQMNIAPADKSQCLAVGGQWNESISSEKPIPSAPTAPATTKVTGYCNVQFTCQKDYQAARESFERNVFITLIALGVVSIVLSFALAGTAIVSLGLSLGGVLSLVIASIRYWGSLNDLWRLAILAVALAVLIWLGIKKFKD
jgi:hypothetical protein